MPAKQIIMYLQGRAKSEFGFNNYITMQMWALNSYLGTTKDKMPTYYDLYFADNKSTAKKETADNAWDKVLSNWQKT